MELQRDKQELKEVTSSGFACERRRLSKKFKGHFGEKVLKLSFEFKEIVKTLERKPFFVQKFSAKGNSKKDKDAEGN